MFISDDNKWFVYELFSLHALTGLTCVTALKTCHSIKEVATHINQSQNFNVPISTNKNPESG